MRSICEMRLEHVRDMIATLQRERGDDVGLTDRYQALLQLEADLHEGPLAHSPLSG
jgi:hypothetical protein